MKQPRTLKYTHKPDVDRVFLCFTWFDHLIDRSRESKGHGLFRLTLVQSRLEYGRSCGGRINSYYNLIFFTLVLTTNTSEIHLNLLSNINGEIQNKSVVKVS